MSQDAYILDTNRELAPDVPHPTRIRVVPRSEDYSSQRTDKRPSVAYVVEGICGQPEPLELVFHEGCNPFSRLNGLLLEDVAAILCDRLATHQAGPFACEENGEALDHFRAGLACLAERRKRRAAEGTLGTRVVDPPAAT